MSAVPPNLLVAEDNPDDVLLLRRALQRALPAVALHVVEDGESAIAWLAGRGAYADRARHPLPHLVLLDWKLPRASGREVLAWLRAQPWLDMLPVVVLSSSGEREDVREAFAAGANAYLQKPGSTQELQSLVGKLLGFWLEHNLPAAQGAGPVEAQR